MSLGRQRDAAILVLLTVLGGLWRLASFRFNVWPHGDVVIDAAIAESVAWRGRLLVPFVDVRYYPIERFGFGYPPDQHPPLWPLLGAPLVWLAGDGYTALKLVSLLIGIGLIPLTYFALRPHVGCRPALFASALAAFSFPLVDFSGNGSLWALLAAFYLAWLWAIPVEDPPPERSSAPGPVPEEAPTPNPSPVRGGGETGHATVGTQFIAPAVSPTVSPSQSQWGGDRGVGPLRRWALVGIVMGLAYLTNYPAVVLPVALGALHLVRHGRQSLRWPALAGPALSALVMLAVIAPWLVVNAAWFGGPFWSQPFQRTLSGGSRELEYLLVDGQAVKRNLPSSGDRMAALRERAIDLYGNVGFVAKQSLVLAPALGGLFLLGLLMLAPGRGGLPPGPWPVAVLALVHLALIVWWPTTKFRYLVPLLPLVFGLGSWALWQLRPESLRWRLAAVTLGLCFFTNAWTMLSIPSRTYYYDGGLIGDNFGQQGERLFVEEVRGFRAAADAIMARGQGVVLGDHILAPFTRMPLVVNSTGYPPEVVEHLVRRYQIRYVVIDRPHAALYDSLRPTPIWSDDRLVVLELPAN
jgi:4-amino-4-deoxy-L-arabinose transferase-like glycosyltransferase